MYIIHEDGPGALDHSSSKCITHVYIVLKEIFDKKNKFKNMKFMCIVILKQQ